MGRIKLKVFLADDHAMFANALAMTVEGFEEVDQVEVFPDGKKLLTKMETDLPHVVITDLDMPEIDGLEVIRRINKKYPSVKVILLTMYDNLEIVRRALDLGAHAFLTKSFEPIELRNAIQGVVLRDFYHNELMFKALKLSILDRPTKEYNSISQREREILKLICEEFTMKEIGDQLSISEKTVQNHRQALLRKLDVKNTAGLVKKAIEIGVFRIS